MLSQLGRTRSGLVAGVLALALFLAVEALMPADWRSSIREKAFDVVLTADRRLRTPKAETIPLVIVDIDRPSLEKLGPWPWPRETMARLVESVAAGKPSAIAIDILFAQTDTRSPAALARQLGNITHNPDILALAKSLPDGDQRLATAIKDEATVLGFVLDTDTVDPVPGVPVLARERVALDGIWRASGGIAPVSPLLDETKGLGALSLPGDADGKIRRVPLLVGVGDKARPGFALETVRLIKHAPALTIDIDPVRIKLADLGVPLPRDALLRLAWASPGRRSRLSAADVIEHPELRQRLANTVVLIGGSAPELGGLRDTPGDPLRPSVEIQAEAVEQMLSHRAPRAIPPGLELGLTLLIGLIALVAASLPMSPVVNAALTVLALVAMWAAALLASLTGDRLIDPVMPSLGGLVVFMASSLSSYALVRRREATIRSRFEQHLAPAVVRRIAENPGLLKLRGEKREITALFTDIENFTAMTHRAGPEQLVAVLDEYIEGMTAIVMKHGGMVDKIVGDSVHAFFNAPLDLEGHAQHAVDCADEMRIWSKGFQAQSEPSEIGFGRTRIGIETGMAVVGDIGIRSKLDYTAHGDSINSAARLEALNKVFGSTICVGPGAAARCDGAQFRPLGVASLRGLETPVAVVEPWPPAASAAWRERYVAAFRLKDADSGEAAARFEELARECPEDAVPRVLAEGLRKGPSPLP
jgi:adenylate cyclase